MTISIRDVRDRLDPEEVDYAAAAELGPEALPVLAEIVRGDDAMLASKAAYLATLIGGDRQREVVAAAAASPHAIVRVAAAGGLRNLPEDDVDALADGLLTDDDIGVRAQAVRSVARFPSARMADRLRHAAESDADEALRTVAAGAISDRG